MAKTRPLFIADFHVHHVPSTFTPTTVLLAPLDQRERWKAINRLLADEEALIEPIQRGDVDARIVNIPTALIGGPNGEVPEGTIQHINDSVAELVRRHPGRLHGLATVDAYAGDDAAAEVERAVFNLGLRGVFVESAKGDLLIGAPQARPALKAAAKLGVPVFIHPINPPAFSHQLAPYGRLGTSFSRGAINGAAIISLLEGGAFAELPELQVVVTALAFGGIALAATFGYHGRSEPASAVLRRHVHVDTMGFYPVLIRASVDFLGPERVLVGTDWPIVVDGLTRSRIEKSLAAAGLDETQQRLVAGLNSLRLLDVKPDSVQPSKKIAALA